MLVTVVEALMCMYPDEIKSKRVTIGDPPADTEVPGDTQCRPHSRTREGAQAQRILLRHHCITPSDDCRCSDDQSEYFFKNGAVLHYTFANKEIPKSLTFARRAHGMEPLSFYDAVFVNAGNGEIMKVTDAITTAIEVQHAGAAFFWLSTYTGMGSISKWTEDQAKRFLASGANYVDIESMAKGMEAWTKGAVDGKRDDHYCLPGPPDEIANLLLKIVWAVHEQDEGT